MTVTRSERATPIRMFVGAEIRAEMGRQGLNQTMLAEMIGMRQQYLSARLVGQVPFTVDELHRIAVALERPLGQFLPGSDADLEQLRPPMRRPARKRARRPLPRRDSNTQPAGYRHHRTRRAA